ncbi:hypothetical protein [Stutzerimonas nitrititolerans]|uniref:hypothetical protein n=1 Tax=Stutzerimonas nitrititolerans TaxID=2482751 RepID=UPI002898326F|nr:hypothetical protein [Stutzerimonas nitrititolerans]
MNEIKKVIVSAWGIAALLATGFALSKVASSEYALHIPLVFSAGGVLAIGGVLFLERLLKVGSPQSERKVSFGFELVDVASRQRHPVQVIIFRAVEVEVARREVHGRVCAFLNFPDRHSSSRRPSFSYFEAAPR